MRLDQATIALVPRTMASCLDSAVRFLGAHLGLLSAVWLGATAIAWAALWQLERLDALNLVTTLLVVFLVSSPLGVVVGVATIPAAFGEPMSWDWVLHRLRRQGLRLVALGLFWRIAIAVGAVACMLPGAWIAVRTGFFVEQECLRRMDRALHDRRVKDLVKGEMSDLMTRGAVTIGFCGVLWMALFLTVDQVVSLMFSYSIFAGRAFGELASGRSPSLDYILELLWSDRRVMMAAAAVALFVYVVARLGWFFCYVDLRVRRDCWDTELRFSQEARRLQAAAPGADRAG